MLIEENILSLYTSAFHHGCCWFSIINGKWEKKHLLTYYHPHLSAEHLNTLERTSVRVCVYKGSTMNTTIRVEFPILKTNMTRSRAVNQYRRDSVKQRVPPFHYTQIFTNTNENLSQVSKVTSNKTRSKWECWHCLPLFLIIIMQVKYHLFKSPPFSIDGFSPSWPNRLCFL